MARGSADIARRRCFLEPYLSLPAINSFWSGATMDPIHAACLASYIRMGHPVRVFIYDKVEGLPAGVETTSAAEVFPLGEAQPYLRDGALALLSDLVRYRILAAGAGIWSDADCFCVQPLADADYVFGAEDDAVINGAVLKAPPGSPLLDALLAIGEGFIPPWEPRSRQQRWELRKRLWQPKPLRDMRWGTAGPWAITHYVNALGLGHLELPSDVLYPVHWRQAGKLLDPGLALDEVLSRRTRVVHFYGFNIRQALTNGGPAAGSPMAELLAGRRPSWLAG